MVAGAKPIHVETLRSPDHQSVSYPSSAAFQSDAMATTLYFSNEIGIPIRTPAVNSNGWATKQDWARHQALIKQLYLDEKKPLKEVMRLMRNQHDFKATLVLHAMLLVHRIFDIL